MSSPVPKKTHHPQGMLIQDPARRTFPHGRPNPKGLKLAPPYLKTAPKGDAAAAKLAKLESSPSSPPGSSEGQPVVGLVIAIVLFILFVQGWAVLALFARQRQRRRRHNREIAARAKRVTIRMVDMQPGAGEDPDPLDDSWVGSDAELSGSYAQDEDSDDYGRHNEEGVTDLLWEFGTYLAERCGIINNGSIRLN